MNDATIAGVDMRTKFKIIVDILEIAKNGANKTGIVYRTNLNFRVADKYLDLLLKRDLWENRHDLYIIKRLRISSPKSI